MLWVLLLGQGLLPPRGTLQKLPVIAWKMLFLPPAAALTARVAVDGDRQLLPTLKTCTNGILKDFVFRGSYFRVCWLAVAISGCSRVNLEFRCLNPMGSFFKLSW